MAALYRVHRPQTFSEIIGQEHVVRTLKNAVTSGSVSHAYVFTGSRGVGKTSLARILAKAVNCTNSREGEACLKCAVCTAVQSNTFLDLIEIDAASNTGVENVRELIEHVRFRPSTGKYKVFIIDEVHMLSKQAFNALLKTLEEPPAHAIFILATTEIHKVPDTIISRAQRFDFNRLRFEDIVSQLERVLKKEKLKLSLEVTHEVARHAEGSGRDALSILDKVLTLGKDSTLTDVQKMLGSTDLSNIQTLVDTMCMHLGDALPEFFDSLSEQGTDFYIFNKDVLEYLRKILVDKLGAPVATSNVSSEQMAILKKQSAAWSIGQILFTMRLFLRSYKELSTSPTPDLPVLLAAIEAALKGAKIETVSVPTAATVISVPLVQTRQGPISSSPEILGARESSAMASGDIQYESITKEEVEQCWSGVIDELKKVNSPLATLMKNSPVEEITESTIVVGVRYLFHKEHLESIKNHGLITAAIKKMTGKMVQLQVRLVKQPEAAKVDPVEALSDALKVFGGEILD